MGYDINSLTNDVKGVLNELEKFGNQDAILTTIRLLLVVECCSHISWLILADKSTLEGGLRSEVLGKTRWLDAATHAAGALLFKHPGHLVMLIWHAIPSYINMRTGQYAKYMDLVDGLDMLTYITSVYMNVPVDSWQFAAGVGLYALARVGRCLK